MASKRIARKITDKRDIEFLLSINEEDITTSFMMNTFGKFKGKNRFNPYDEITIPIGSYGPEGKKNKNAFKTTVGLWIFNKYFIEKDLFDEFKYINKTLNGDDVSDMMQKITYSLLEDRLSTKDMSKFLMKTQKIMPFVNILCPGYTEKMLLSAKVMADKQKQLLPKYKERLDKNDALAAEELEKELLSYAKEYLKDDPSMDIFNSGARGSFGNHYKNMFVMKGAVKDPDPTKGYNIMLGNYMNGIPKEEYTTLANSLAYGPYSRSGKTASGGYMEKLFMQAFQHIVLDKPNSDCHTDKYIKVKLDKKNISSYMYSYMIEGGRLVELTSENMNNYIGKEVKFRFASVCKSKTGICNKCAGTLFNRLGIVNIGAATPKIPSVLKMLYMKAFHDSVVKTIEIDPWKAFNLR